MLGIQRQVHLVHTTLNLNLQRQLEGLLCEVFGAQRYSQGYSPLLDRDSSLVLIGDMCIEPLSKRFEGTPVGSASWIKTNGQRFHSVAFKIEDVHAADEHLASRGLSRVYADPEFRNTFFLTEPRESFNAIIEFCQKEMPNDLRLRNGWSQTWWRDSHPLGIEKLSSISAVVSDIEDAMRLYRDVFGFQPLGQRDLEGEGARVAAYWAGESIFELMQPTTRRTPLDDCLRLRGEGWYAVNFKVKSAKKAAAYLKSHGLRLIGDEQSRFIIDPQDTFDAVYGFTQDEIPGDPRAE